MSSRDQSSVWGSPPRMRGAAIDVPKASITPRIIPACAGNRIKECSYNSSLRDHPHVCGEQNAHSVRTVPVLGSSPRVRGTVDGERDALTRRGIIPARAGSSLSFKPNSAT